MRALIECDDVDHLQGALFPAMHAMLGQWAPPMERSLLCGLTYAGKFI